ncbi:unnamed protein product [Linum tenue]|uniref:FAE domain-containing protein n=1 Tax=Linum tenue TaxID=586396 RepID=A0AAV0NRE3_9ROSI|nr:unnamed protein product [Linum tenue]
MLYKSLYRNSHKNCYLLGYQCYKAPDDLKLSSGTAAKIALRNRNLGLEEYRFMVRTMVRSGIGEETYIPRNIMEMTDATFSNLDSLFARSAVSPCQIDILVTTGSLFAPVPSLSSRIVNRYGMKESIKCFSLTGMGCSSSVIAVDLVQQLFNTHPNSFAVVVAVELTAPNWYGGTDSQMMLSNVLFRAGGSSLILTNHPSWKDQRHPEAGRCGPEPRVRQRGVRMCRPRGGRPGLRGRPFDQSSTHDSHAGFGGEP